MSIFNKQPGRFFDVVVTDNGDPNMSDSQTVRVTVTAQGTSTVVTVIPDEIEWMQMVDFHAVITPDLAGGELAGTVTFQVGSITYGTATVAADVADLEDIQIANMPDGDSGTNFTVTAKFTSSNNVYSGSSGTTTFHVDPRTGSHIDTYGFYTGDRVAWTTGENSNTTTIKLVATLVDTNTEASGDITQATVTFSIDGQPIPSAQNLPVGLVDPDDPTTGTAVAIVQLNISKTATSGIFYVDVNIGGAYDEGIGLADSQIMVIRPTAGGRILGANALLSNLPVISPTKASGYLGDHSLFSLSAFDVTYNKSLKNPQGKLSVLITTMDNVDGERTSRVHVYQVTSNAIALLQVTGNKALFSSKCTVKELVDGVWVSIEGNAKLDMSMTDLNPANPILYDTLAITVFKAQGGVWYSINWNGVYTVEQNVLLVKDQITVQ
jgi:hypothetical protein